MAEIVEKINELRELNEGQHLFCPRVGNDAAIYYDEDLAEFEPETDPAELKHRQLKLREAEHRKWTALKAMEILAFDGEEAAPHKEWLINRLDHLMQSCDVCIRVFYQSRAEWKTRLIDSYDEENIRDFLRVVDEHCLERIQRGMDEAKRILSAKPPNERKLSALSTSCTYAFFEALSCGPALRNEEFLQQHFDEPFDMVQTKRRLKIQTYLPAMTRFLFSRNARRHRWATETWSTSKRNILKSEFDWAVRDDLVSVMTKVQMNNLDMSMVPLFWSGARLITSKMDRDLITDCIRGLDGGFYRLMLDHLSLNSEALLDLIATMKQLLEKSPVDYWDGMNAITPSIATVVEQVFNSPTLNQLLLVAIETDEQSLQNLHAAFSWIPPFLASIKESHLGPAIRPFGHALFERYQSDKYSRQARTFCFREGLKVLDYAFRKMGEGKTSDKFVGQPTVNGMLEMLSRHIHVLVSSLKRFKTDKTEQGDLQLALSVIQHAFQLEAQSLIVERQLISAKQPSPTETPPSSPIWRVVLKAIDSQNLELATHLLIAGRNLIGLEPLQMKPGVEKVPITVRHFNDRFTLLSQSITDTVDRLSEFDPMQLQTLFEKQAAASAIVSLLFSSTEGTRNSAIELLKVISSEEVRSGALRHILKVHYKHVVQGISDSIRQVRLKKAFAPAPSMIMTCKDIIEVMCNSQDGILRGRTLDSEDAGVTMNLWKNMWDSLTMIFATTEAWSNLGVYEKTMMMDFCRNTMEFADELFDQCSIFATALKGVSADDEESTPKTALLKELLALPANAMDGLVKWLRLRDEFLSSKSTTLISKLLKRLHEVSIEVDANTLSYMENILSGEVRAKLSSTQQATLQQALETHLGRPVVKEEEPAKPKQASIDNWMSTGATAPPSEDQGTLLAHLTSGSRAFQARREQMRAAENRIVKQKAIEDQKNASSEEFRRRRQAELQQRAKEKEAAVAKAKAARGISTHIAEAGSGLEGLGVLGKDTAAKGEGLMHSSDESENSEGDIDEDLFGIKKINVKAEPKTNIVNEIKVQLPVKKKRVQRSIKDMRARLAPDLGTLHRTILGWNYFHEGDFPPNSWPEMYSKVLSTFRTPNDYQSTFEPLLTLEAWQGFVKAREESQAKPYDVRITSRASVDAFQEVGSTMTHSENKEVFISEGDIVLLSQSRSPSANEPTCLARVFKVMRRQQHIEVSYRVVPSNPLSSALKPNSTLVGTKLQSITSLEREYGALKGLQYYDLCDEIIRARPSPLLTYKESQIQPLISNYNVNTAQAKAIKSAIDNDAFTLIQGPPGSGKTKTITAIVGALLSDSLRDRGTIITVPGQPRSQAVTKKLLVCAPSNAAVDELVMRFKDGITTLNGEKRNVNIVRLGRSEAIKANVRDVTLEELVKKKMGRNSSKVNDAEATRKMFQEHKQISDQLRQAYMQRDTGEIKGEDAVRLDDDINALRKQKIALGTKIDSVRDEEKLAIRNADLIRRRAQETVLNDAHVICATLSGSGHEMFQGLSIEFETVIVDEAAQCVEMSALIPLKYGCAKCILVGDPKQLPPTVFSKEAARFQYEQSLFVRMQKNHPNDVHLLDTQYRMHPEISLFPSQTFYDGRLLDGGDMAGLRQKPWHQTMLLGPYRFFDVQGQHQAASQGHSLINIAEINIAMQLYERLTSDYSSYDFKGKVGIITPYKSQLQELKLRFENRYGASILEDIDFNTTDAFQGRESEVIIFSCVRASPAGGIGFLQDIRRMNVGLTRAKSSLWVLGNSQSLARGEFWRKLIADARNRKRYTRGDVQMMLNQHSSQFPAPTDGYARYVQSHRLAAAPIHEPTDRPGGSHEEELPVVAKQAVKQETMTDTEAMIKQEATGQSTLVHHGKRKFEQDSSLAETKKENIDLEMDDAPSDSASNTLNGGSGCSTPAAASGASRDTSKGPDGIDPKPNDIIGAMSKPKIRRRPREAPNPFIKKKPRTG